MLEIKNAACGYGSRVVVEHISFTVNQGEVWCVLGPNGAGKTTLFKSILRHLPLLGGQILLYGKDMAEYSRRELAMRVGYVPQAHTPPFPFTVQEVVVTGRTARISLFSAPSREDKKIAADCLERLGVAHLKDRSYTEISGGERQLVLIARALAQQPEILMMDEPTANLDFGNQIRMLREIKRLADSGLAVVMTTHFPDHVFMCATKVAMIRAGGETVVGKTREVMTSEALSALYGVPLQVTEAGNCTVCIPK